ncbi:MAG: metabolite traffic protein EboE [Verrucomicrobiales bacterium]|nr:metabolite traffic protein EboE [Verrucomicrobiales bacterium]
MHLANGRHLAYCTNIHRGESWEEILRALKHQTLAVRDRIAVPGTPYAIGLRLSAAAAQELKDRQRLAEFRRWLERESCYVFTINGFPYGRFHGGRVKEQVYVPDWTTRERVEYTCLLADILAEIVPAGVEGSISTVPVSFKAFGLGEEALARARGHLWECVEHFERVSSRSGRHLHLGLEPEPLCTLETTSETVEFLERLGADRPQDARWRRHLGVNYDCCHLAIQFESAAQSLGRLHERGILLSKVHLSNALTVRPDTEARSALEAFTEDTYLHQVVARGEDGTFSRFGDLPAALEDARKGGASRATEWRIHFHVPLHHLPSGVFGTTSEHVADVLDWLRDHPGVGSHLEMETYTWEVLPPEIKSRSVTDQLSNEYLWTFDQLRNRKQLLA